MEKYYQKTDKDCLSAVVGTLLQIEPDTIPLFVDLDTWRIDYGKWLFDNHGIVLIHYKFGEGAPYVGIGEYYAIGTLKHEDKKHSHAVVLKCVNINDEEIEYNIWHDPLGSKSPYKGSDLTHIELFVSLKDAINGGI